jgi:hypothetical protein
MNKEEILSLSGEEQRQLLMNTTSTELLDILSHSSSLDIKIDVARHPNTTAETLRRLYFEDDLLCRHIVAKTNPNTPKDILIHHKAERFYLLKPHLKLAH